MYHALALYAASFASSQRRSDPIDAAGWLLITGVTLFSGSLCLAAITNVTLFRLIPGLGDLALLAGWPTLIGGALRRG